MLHCVTSNNISSIRLRNRFSFLSCLVIVDEHYTLDVTRYSLFLVVADDVFTVCCINIL